VVGPVWWQGPRVAKENHFDEPVARLYDETSADMFDPAVVDPVVDVLAELAGAGAALEFGVGTGRIALPLSRRGVEVHGIDLSAAMVDKLRVKPGAAEIDVHIGDFASCRVEGTFSLVYLVWNTIGNLTTQEDQVDCFRNAAVHLAPGGRFVIEVEVPQLQRLPPGETVRPFLVTQNRFGFDEYDVARQGLISHHYVMIGEKARVFSMPFRYVWPAELDLMARLGGMRLESRWGGWTSEPFTSDSTSHVSVWRTPADGEGTAGLSSP